MAKVNCFIKMGAFTKESGKGIRFAALASCFTPQISWHTQDIGKTVVFMAQVWC
jgi:hypothetical protein